MTHGSNASHEMTVNYADSAGLVKFNLPNNDDLMGMLMGFGGDECFSECFKKEKVGNKYE